MSAGRVPFPWRSVAALVGMGVVLIWCFGAPAPGPSVGEQRDTRLSEAVAARDSRAVERALAAGASPQGGSLAVASAHDDLPTMAVLLAHGADVNAKNGTTDGRGYVWEPTLHPHTYDQPRLYWRTTTPLMEAVLHDNLTAARLLLDRGAHVNACNDAGVTALTLAAGSARARITQALLARGADVNAKAGGGWTALMSAAVSGQEDVARLLVAHGADVNAQDIRGNTPLALATVWHQPAVAAFLCAHGARVPLPPLVVAPQPPPLAPAPSRPAPRANAATSSADPK